MAKNTDANAMSGLLDLAAKMGKTVPVENKEPAKKEAKPTAKKEVKKTAAAKKPAEKVAPAKKGAEKAPVAKKSTEKAAAAKKSTATKNVKEAAPAPKKKEAVEEKAKKPAIEKKAVEMPVSAKEEKAQPVAGNTVENERKNICVSTYYSASQLRLMKAAAKKAKLPLSQYISGLVLKDLEENAEVYETVAKKLDVLAAMEEDI